MDIALSPPSGHGLDLASNRAPGHEEVCVADTTDRFLDAIAELNAVADEVTPEEAAKSFDETTLQNFWRDWPHISGWAGALWRKLSEDIEQHAAPATDEDLHEVGGAG